LEGQRNIEERKSSAWVYFWEWESKTKRILCCVRKLEKDFITNLLARYPDDRFSLRMDSDAKNNSAFQRLQVVPVTSSKTHRTAVQQAQSKGSAFQATRQYCQN